MNEHKGQEPRTTGGTTRRDFLKGSAVALGGLTIGSMFAGLTGCSGENQAPVTSQTVSSGREVIVHEADVVVVGGGLAACTAARRVLTSGKTLAVVDKGRFGHSGASGENWGAGMNSAEFAQDGGEGFFNTLVNDFFGLVDQDWAWEIVKATIEGSPIMMVEQTGCVQQRNPDDGAPFGNYGPQFPTGATYGAKARRYAQQLHRMGADVYDRTMVIDVLQDEGGHAAGVVGIDLKTGMAHVFRSKQVIMATGSFSWSLKPTILGPEDTGDGHAIFAKRGLALANMELVPIDYTVINPYATVDDTGRDAAGILTLNVRLWDRAQNSKGDVYCTKYFTSEEYKKNPASGFARFMIGTMKQIYQGETIFMETGALDREHPKYPYGMTHAFIEDAPWGIGYTFENLEESGQNFMNSVGAPKQSTTMETEIPGLFSAVQALTYYGQTQAFGQGWVAGNAAAAAAGEMELPKVQWDEVSSALETAYGHLEKDKPAQGLRSIEIAERIRNANHASMPYPREEGKLQTGLDELRRIREEDLPNMYCATQSRVMNGDWRNALEVDAMLMCSECATLASLERKESRPWFYRADYPVTDNENWLKNIYCSYEGDGAWSLSAVDVNATRIPLSELKKTIEVLDLNEPED